MSLEQFLAELEKPESTGGASFVTIAKARVFFCWQGWTNNESKLFEYNGNDNESEAKAKADCQAYIDSGENRFEQWPQKGFATQIYGDDVPTKPDGKFEWGDSLDFVKRFESDVNIGRLTEDEQKLVNGPMPFTLVTKGVVDNSAVADWKTHWVKLSREVNQWSRAKGKKNKDGYDLRVYVIQHVYKNEKEAKAEAEKIKAEQPAQTVANGELSAKALETWGDLASLQGQKENIEKAIQEAEKKLAPSAAQATTAKEYGIEEVDLSVIGIEVSPF